MGSASGVRVGTASLATVGVAPVVGEAAVVAAGVVVASPLRRGAQLAAAAAPTMVNSFSISRRVSRRPIGWSSLSMSLHSYVLI